MLQKLIIMLFAAAILGNNSIINAATSSYTFNNLSSDDFGGTAIAINNLGQIVGNTSVAVPFPDVPKLFIISDTATL